MCQDTGTAIVVGKRGQRVLTAGPDEEAISRGVYDAYVSLNLRYSQMAPLTMWEERNTGSNLPAQIELYADTKPGHETTYDFLFMAKGGGSANKSYPVPGDQGRPQPHRDAGVPRGEDPLTRDGSLPAVPPGDRHRRHVRGVRAEDREVRQRPLSRRAAQAGIAAGQGFRDHELEAEVLALTQRLGHRRAVRRQVLLPRRARRPSPATRRLSAGRHRRVLLSRPPGAGPDHRGGRVSRAAGTRTRALPAGDDGRAPHRRRRARRPAPSRWARSARSCRRCPCGRGCR